MVERPVVGWPRMDVDWGELGQGTGLLGASMEMTSGSPAPQAPVPPPASLLSWGALRHFVGPQRPFPACLTPGA